MELKVASHGILSASTVFVRGLEEKNKQIISQTFN